LRDTALRYDSRTVISKDEAVRLMEIAKQLRPQGPTINKFLDKYKEGNE